MSFLKNKWLYIILVIALGSIYLYNWNQNKDNNDNIKYVKVTRENLYELVGVIGKVRPRSEVNLSFENSGRLTNVYVDEGDIVKKNQILAEIDSRDLISNLNDARAYYDSTIAKLNELKRGSRPENIQIKETELENSNEELKNIYKGIQDILFDSYAKANNAVRKETDSLFINDEELNPQLSFSIKNSQLKINIEQKRYLVSNTLNNWQQKIIKINSGSSDSDLDSSLNDADDALKIIKNFFDLCSQIIQDPISLTPEVITLYKTNIANGISSVNLAISNVNIKKQQIISGKLTKQKAENELNLLLAGTPIEQINSQEAIVKQASAKIQSIETSISKTKLYAPFDGIIINAETNVGEIVTPNSIVISLISDSEFELKADISEIEIAKLKIGNIATIYLDALGKNITFEASVIKINTAAKIIDGVTTYETTLQFANKDSRLKSGMTANIEIETANRENVLTLPQRVIYSRDNKYFIKKRNLDSYIEIEVNLGLNGSAGNVEILSGVKENDEVLTNQI